MIQLLHQYFPAILGISISLNIFILLIVFFKDYPKLNVKLSFSLLLLKLEYELTRKLGRNHRTEDVDVEIERIVALKMKKLRRNYTGYIILRYGSSVKIQIDSPNDYDYCVLMFGYSSQKYKCYEGTVYKPKIMGKHVDIMYKDFNSFLISLVAGMPFEHGVIANCLLVSGDIGYVNWLKVVKKQTVYERSYVIKMLKELLHEQYLLLDKQLSTAYDYNVFRILYIIASTITQIMFFENIENDYLPYDSIEWIAEPENILRSISDADFKKAYIQIFKYYKKIDHPVDMQKTVDSLRKLILPKMEYHYE